MKQVTTIAVAFAIVAGTGMAAHASSISGTLSSVSGDGPYVWTYDAVLNGPSGADAGDYFFVADFDGYIEGTFFAPTDWNGMVENTSTCPALQDCSSDQAAIPNLRFTYGGATINNLDVGTAFPLGQFGAQSIYDDEIVGLWSNGQAVGVPAAAVPEPGTLFMLGLGLLGVGFSARRRS